MYLGQTVTALLGFGSLAVAAPTASEHEGGSISRASRHKRSGLVSSAFQLNQTNVGTVNFGKIGSIGQLAQISQFAQLVQIAETQFLAQVQSQVLLAAQLQTIKNNIRINTLKARFPQVNTVLVTVTNVIDARDPLNLNRRYLLNHVLVDNGFADKEQIVMVTESQDMTITADATTTVASTATAAATEAADASPTVDIAALISSALIARGTATAASTAAATDAATDAASATPVSTFSVPLGVGGVASQIISQQSTVVTAFNPNVPFNFVDQIGKQLLLPYDTAAPSSQFVLDDPANIIFAGNHNFFVQSLATFQTDCLQFGLGGNAFVGAAAGLALFGSVQQAITAQLTTIQIGTRVQAIPPVVLLGHPNLAAGHPELAAALSSAQASAFASPATSVAEATASAATTAAATTTVV